MSYNPKNYSRSNDTYDSRIIILVTFMVIYRSNGGFHTFPNLVDISGITIVHFSRLFIVSVNGGQSKKSNRIVLMILIYTATA